jgi:formylmethanofuran dehydrogenase subunit C
MYNAAETSPKEAMMLTGMTAAQRAMFVRIYRGVKYVDVRGIHGQVDIRSSGEYDEAEVRITATMDVAEGISTVLSAGRLIVRDTNVRRLGSIANDLRVVVFVPPHTTVRVKSIVGEVTIGNLYSIVNVESSSGYVWIRDVENLVATARGSSTITVSGICANATLTSYNSGYIVVTKGQTVNLTAIVHNNGRIVFSGYADTSYLSVKRNGYIMLEDFLTRPCMSQASGAGEIVLGRDWRSFRRLV